MLDIPNCNSDEGLRSFTLDGGVTGRGMYMMLLDPNSP